jgi:hypothetical protein
MADTTSSRLGIVDSLPATRWPGVMLFRKKDPTDTSLVLTYLVGEVPTAGVHACALQFALDERHSLVERQQVDTIRIVGPAFSGSSWSIRRSLENWLARKDSISTSGVTSTPICPSAVTQADSAKNPNNSSGRPTPTDSASRASATRRSTKGSRCRASAAPRTPPRVRDSTIVAIVSGSASDSNNVKIFSKSPFEFKATVHTSQSLDAAAKEMITHYLGIGTSQIAFLHEGTTQYGQSLDTLKRQEPSKAAGGTPNKKRPVIKDSSLMLAFPMNISSLRVQYARHPEAPQTTNREVPPALQQPRLALDQREPASLTESPAVLSQLTAPAIEILMGQIERSLLAHRIRAVGILATDIRDQLFVASEVRRRLRDVQIFFYRGNALLLRSDYRSAVEGSLVLSTYPLFVENQYWDLTHHLPERIAFVSDEAEGVFNALLYQLGDSAAMTDYALPIHNAMPLDTVAPPIWLTVVGHEAIYPVALLSARANPMHNGKPVYPFSRQVVDSSRTFAEALSSSGGFLFLLFLILAGFVVAFVVLDQRTAPRANAIVASPDDLAIPKRPKSAQERVAFQRAASWASLLLHRELYAVLRYFSLFAAFAGGLLLILRPRSHGIVLPVWTLLTLAIVAAILSAFVAVRAVGQSWRIWLVGREYGLRYVLGGVWPSRRDRVFSSLEILARLGILVAGFVFFLIFLAFIFQVLLLDQRRSAFFFQRAVSVAGDVSPAVPIVLAAIGFVAWCSWHLMRIQLLAEPTIFEEFLLHQAAAKPLVQRLVRLVRKFQDKSERRALFAVDRSYRAIELARKTTKTMQPAKRKGYIAAATRMLSEAQWAAEDAQNGARSAKQLVDAKREDIEREQIRAVESACLDTRDIRRAAEKAQKAVTQAEDEFVKNNMPVPASARPTPRTSRSPLEQIRHSYNQFEIWYNSSELNLGVTRASNAARGVRDALLHLVPNGPALFMAITVLVFAGWLWFQLERSMEALVFTRHWWLGYDTAFDALMHLGIVTLVIVTGWAVYRLAEIWSRVRVILGDIPADLLPSLVNLPKKLARVTRLTPFGRPSRSEIDDVVEEKWKAMEKAYQAAPNALRLAVDGRDDKRPQGAPPLARSRPYELDSGAQEAFVWLHGTLDWCRQSRLLRAADESLKNSKQDSHTATREEQWARAAADVYAAYVADYVDWTFQHLRYLAAFLLTALLLLVVLLSAYPFQPQGLLKAIYTVELVAGVATLVYVVVQMNRDEVLSAISNTTGGAVTWDPHFVSSLVTYAALPLLTLVSTEVPQVRDFLFSWVTPLLRVFSKG